MEYTARAILGFELDNSMSTIRVPTERVLGARNVISTDAIRRGNTRIPLRDVQTLSVLRHHWVVAGSFGGISLRPIDVLLAHADEASSYITCDGADFRTCFWTLLEVLRLTA